MKYKEFQRRPTIKLELAKDVYSNKNISSVFKVEPSCVWIKHTTFSAKYLVRRISSGYIYPDILRIISVHDFEA